MRSWIFRHRLRLRAIYGPRPEPALVPSTLPSEPRAVLDGLAPGECAWRGRWYVMRPRAEAS